MKKAKQKKKKFVIVEDTPIIEITERFPHIAEFLINDYGFFCVGCPLSYEETIFQGALVHGYSEDEAKELIKELNSMI